MKKQKSGQIALGGLMAALAVVVMSLGGMIPLATYVCCVLCVMLCGVVLGFCGSRVAWAWYGAVSILGLLLGTDKEAAALFAFIGYYPILKPLFDKKGAIGFIGKILFFNIVILIGYLLLIYLLGMAVILAEFTELGMIGGGVMILLGNLTFILLDRLLLLLNRKVR